MSIHESSLFNSPLVPLNTRKQKDSYHPTIFNGYDGTHEDINILVK